jgi:hypothetical protein
VQRRAAQTGDLANGMLKLGSGGHWRLSNRDSELWPDVVAVLAAATTVL